MKQKTFKISMVIVSLVTLASCMTSPRAVCQREAETEVRSINTRLSCLDRQISTKNSNINRGFAIHSQQQKVIVRGTCRTSSGLEYDCPQNGYETVKTPVNINPAEERKTLRDLESQRSKVSATLKPAYSRRGKALDQCQFLPNE
jgi:hypothetical protein